MLPPSVSNEPSLPLHPKLPLFPRLRLFATLVFPRIVAARAQIEAAYSTGSGRAAIEPVVLLGVCNVSYKAQVAESVEERPLQPGEPTAGFAVGVVTQPAHQSDEAGFRERMKKRNAIEGTHSERVRTHGMRRTRFWGLGRVRLGNDFTAAACNIKRWIRRVAWEAGHAAKAVGSAHAVATG